MDSRKDGKWSEKEAFESSRKIFKNMECIQGKEFQEEGERGEPFAVEGESAVFSQGVELGMAPVPGGG